MKTIPIGTYKVGTHGARTVINMPNNTAGMRFSRQVWRDGRIVFIPRLEVEPDENK